MPFLQACIKETLRLYPAGVGLNLKDAPPQGDTLSDGIFIPGGTAVGQCAWRIFRNKTVFGEDAEVWRPERWIELADLALMTSSFAAEERRAAKERLALMDRTCDLSFGYGQFKCLGERIARIELGKCVVEMVRRYEVQVEDVKKPIRREISYGLFLQRGLWCRVEERKEQETKKGLVP
jgi:cytochrome P450